MNNLRKLVISITAIAGSVSIFISCNPEPTEVQLNLANTCNTIAIAGTTTLIGLLDDDDLST